MNIIITQGHGNFWSCVCFLWSMTFRFTESEDQKRLCVFNWAGSIQSPEMEGGMREEDSYGTVNVFWQQAFVVKKNE